MSSLAVSFSRLSRFLELGEQLKRLHVDQMDNPTKGNLFKAVSWMAVNVTEPLCNQQELEALLDPFSEFMSSIEQGVIDGRSFDDSQIPGKTWAELAREQNLKIEVNSLENLAELITAANANPVKKEKNDSIES